MNISEEVLSAIAGAAALDVEGVSALGSGLGSDVAAMVNRKVLSKGVRVAVEEDKVNVDITLMVKYGHVVPDVARAVQESIASAVENTSGLQVAGVNVTVAGVTFRSKTTRRQEPDQTGPAPFCARREKGLPFWGVCVYNQTRYLRVGRYAQLWTQEQAGAPRRQREELT